MKNKKKKIFELFSIPLLIWSSAFSQPTSNFPLLILHLLVYIRCLLKREVHKWSGKWEVGSRTSYLLLHTSYFWLHAFRQYFSLYRTVSKRIGEGRERWHTREKMSKRPQPAPPTSAVGPCSTIFRISRTPGTENISNTISPRSIFSSSHFQLPNAHFFLIPHSLLLIPSPNYHFLLNRSGIKIRK